jgi:hypothetical protein
MQGCGSGLIQSGSGSGSSVFPQSGSTKLLNPDPMRIRIHKGKFEDKFFFQVLKINVKVKNTCSLYHFPSFSYKNVYKVKGKVHFFFIFHARIRIRSEFNDFVDLDPQTLF